MNVERITGSKAFEQGNMLYHARKVTIVRDDSFWKGERNLTATVQEESASCTVLLHLRGGQPASMSCSCGRTTGRSVCAHVAAVLLMIEDLDRRETGVSVTTSMSARKLLRRVSEQNFEDALQRANDLPVKLYPCLIVKKRKLSLSFRIGRSKTYILKDLREFAELLKNHGQATYGKSLSFRHTPEMFSEDSRFWLDLILNESDKEQEIEQQFGIRHPYSAIREIVLNKRLLDPVMTKLSEAPFSVIDENARERTMSIREGNRKLDILVEPYTTDSLQLLCPVMPNVYFGRDHLYLYEAEGKEIYQTSVSYAKAMRPLFEILQSAYANDRLLIQEKDYSAFCLEVLPVIERFAHVEIMEGVELSEYRKNALETEFYFDRPSDHDVTLEIRLTYGDYSFNPVKENGDNAYHDLAREYRIRETAGRYFPYRDEEGRLTIQGDDSQLFRLLTEGMPEFLALGTVYATDAFRGLRVRKQAGLQASYVKKGDSLLLSLDAGDLDREEILGLLAAYREKRRYYRLKSNAFLELTDPGLRIFSELEQGLHLAKSDNLKDIEVPVYKSYYVEQVLSEYDRRTPEYFRERLDALVPTPIPESIRPVMRDYQKAGFSWIDKLSQLGFGGVLADDMGLGKTLQMIAILLAKKGESRMSLVVCPASLVFNWKKEIEKFAPELNAVMVIGTAAERRRILTEAKADVLLTSYELLRRDSELYEGKEFLFMAADEAQYIKNQGTLSAQAIKSIRAQHRFALTGTPIENRVSELWSIFDYLMPGFLGDYPSFREEYELPIAKGEGDEVLMRLKRLIRPFLLRRMKSDVLTELPERTEETIYSELRGEQKKLYYSRVANIRETLLGTDERELNRNKLQILTELMRLRQLCCDPSLILEDYRGDSVKLETCMEYVRRAISLGHKVLLFSTFASMLKIIESRLKKEKIDCFLLDGSTSKEKRSDMTERFQNEEVPVFLISMKAGGTGLNLTAADVVILYDPWWNPAVENQAADRAYRIGQTKPVTVYRMIVSGTLEDQIQQVQHAKQLLGDDLLAGSASPEKLLTKDMLLDLLKER